MMNLKISGLAYVPLRNGLLLSIDFAIVQVVNYKKGNHFMTTDPQTVSMDAYSPAEIAHKVDQVGVKKANLSILNTLLLAVLAGAFIALGGIFAIVASTGSELGFGPTKVLAGTVFSLGLILVVVAGAELFTGNNLVAMAWASGNVSTKQILRNWILVYVGTVSYTHLTLPTTPYV